MVETHGHKMATDYDIHDHSEREATTELANGRHTHPGKGHSITEERTPNGCNCYICGRALLGNPNDAQCESCGELACWRHARRAYERYSGRATGPRECERCRG